MFGSTPDKPGRIFVIDDADIRGTVGIKHRLAAGVWPYNNICIAIFERLFMNLACSRVHTVRMPDPSRVGVSAASRHIADLVRDSIHSKPSHAKLVANRVADDRA